MHRHVFNLIAAYDADGGRKPARRHRLADIGIAGEAMLTG
jgi:hypothetical protein